MFDILSEGAITLTEAAKINTPFVRNLHNKAIDLFATMAGESISAQCKAKMKDLTADAMNACFKSIQNTSCFSHLWQIAKFLYTK